jgi:hypothetical protein
MIQRDNIADPREGNLTLDTRAPVAIMDWYVSSDQLPGILPW